MSPKRAHPWSAMLLHSCCHSFSAAAFNYTLDSIIKTNRSPSWYRIRHQTRACLRESRGFVNSSSKTSGSTYLVWRWSVKEEGIAEIHFCVSNIFFSSQTGIHFEEFVGVDVSFLHIIFRICWNRTNENRALTKRFVQRIRKGHLKLSTLMR